MHNSLWVGGSIGRRGFPMLGTGKRGLSTYIKDIFSKGEQGFFYDPNDLTAEKINWRKNQLLNTDDFTAVAWGKNNVAVVKNNIANPFGALGVFKICPNTLPANDSDIRQTVSKKGNGVFSVYLKKAERNFACIDILGRNPTSSEGRLIVDLTTKAINKLGSRRDFIIQEVGDGWLRVAVIFENFASLDVEVRVQVAEDINTYITTGDGTRGIYAHAPQLEFFTDVPSTYQPITDFNSDFIRAFPSHTLFQDAAGTIPVTGAGQPVGLILDKSKGLLIGNEIISDVELNNATNWNVTTNVAVSNGVATFTNATTAQALISPGGITSLNQWYEIEIFVDSITSGQLIVVETGGSISSALSVGLNKVKILANGNFSRSLRIYAMGTTNAVVSKFSAKPITGNHAYQTTSACRPILRQTPILSSELLPDPEFLDASVWSRHGAANDLVLSNGVVTGNNSTGALYIIDGIRVGRVYEASIVVSSFTGSLNMPYDGSGLNIQAVPKQAGTYTRTFTAARPDFFAFYATNFTGTIERVSIKEITGYRTDQNYLEFDGSDDFLQTNNIDFTATDKVSLFAGVRKLSDANIGAVFGLSSAPISASGVFEMYTPTTVGGEGVAYYSRGASTRSVVLTQGLKAPVGFILSAQTDIANNTVICKINQSLTSVAGGNLGGGSFSNNPLFIGRRAGTTLPFNGHIYGLIGIGKLTSDSETAAIEKELAKRTGVTLNV